MNITIEAMEFTVEDIERDRWNAVYLPLPAAPSPQLLSDAHLMAQYCCENTIRLLSNPDGLDTRPLDLQISDHGSKFSLYEHARNALNRVEELERLDPTLVRLGNTSFDELDNYAPAMSAGSEHSEAKNERGDVRQQGDTSTAKTDDKLADKHANVEISDRMQMLLNSAPSEGVELEESNDRDVFGPHDNSDPGRGL